MHKGPFSPHPRQHYLLSCDDSHFDRCEVKLHCGFYLHFYGVWLVESNYCLKAFCHARLALSWPFGSSRRFERGFFGQCPSVFPGHWLLQLQVQDICGKRKTQGIHHRVVVEVPSWSAFSSHSPLYSQCLDRYEALVRYLINSFYPNAS